MSEAMPVMSEAMFLMSELYWSVKNMNIVTIPEDQKSEYRSQRI